MRTKSFGVVCLLFLTTFVVKAQTDTIFFDAYWQKISRDSASFFRPAPKPQANGFLIKDYYKSGALQMEGLTLSLPEDAFDGEVTWYYENGKVSQKSVYVKGSREGQTVAFDIDGSELSNGNFKNGEPYNGSFFQSSELYNTINYYDEGFLSRQVSTAKPGTTKTRVEGFYEQGHLKEISFYNQLGNFIGKATGFDEENNTTTGLKAEFFFNPMVVASTVQVKDNVIVSPYTGYYIDGNVKTIKYHNQEGEPVRLIFFDSNGHACDSVFFKEGEISHGVNYEYFNSYYDAAKCDLVQHISSYKNGQRNGAFKTFYPNGLIASETTYADDEMIGPMISYDSLGKQKYTLSYNEGSPWEGMLLSESSLKTYKEGRLVTEVNYWPKGKIMSIFNEQTGTITYDTTGKEIARLELKDGEPFNGKFVLFNGYDISNELIYKNGEKTIEAYYYKGLVTDKTEYNGIEKINSQYYSNGKLKREAKYIDGSEREVSCYAPDGKLLGKFTTNALGEMSGTQCIFDDNNQLSNLNEYRNNQIIRKKTFLNGTLVEDIDYSGNAVFYNAADGKKYACRLKNGLPYEGFFVEYDGFYNTIKRISQYSKGILNGDRSEFIYRYEKSRNEISKIDHYVMGEKTGISREFCDSILIKSVTYRNGIMDGETKYFDKNGNLLATIEYRNDEPFNGKKIEFDYDYNISSECSYKDGVIDGELNYYSEYQLTSSEIYANGVLQKLITTEKGLPKYRLLYKDGEPFEGTRKDYEGVSTFKNGKLIETRTLNDEGQLQSFQIYQRDSSILTDYYKNGATRSIIHFINNLKEGEAVTYHENGAIWAKGEYKNDLPVSGRFIFFNADQDSNSWFEVSISNKEYIATQITDGQPGKRFKYELLLDTKEENTQEIQHFMRLLEEVGFPQ
jgi:antitoxin component YwqK of YwqJK toxin-antitoxin module